MSAALELGNNVGQAMACCALGVPRATFYRHMQPAVPPRARPTPERALDAAERQVVLDHLHAERFRDKAPAEVYATLLEWTKASISARSAPCNASWPNTEN
jgi:putative transposase